MSALQSSLEELGAEGGADATALENLQALIDQAQSDVDDAETELETLQIEAEQISDEYKAL